MAKKLTLKIAVWALAKVIEYAVKEYLSEEDAYALRTRIIDYISAREAKLDLKKGSTFSESRLRVLHFASIVMDSGRLRTATAAGKILTRADGPRLGTRTPDEAGRA